MQIVNDTPFPAERAVHLDKHGAERLVLAFKTVYEISEEGGELMGAAEAARSTPAPEHTPASSGGPSRAAVRHHVLQLIETHLVQR